MSIPGVKGVLELEVGPTPWETRVRPDGMETQMQALARPDGLYITAFLQKVSFPASAEKCRSEWWPGTEKGIKSNGFKIEGLHLSTQGESALVEFAQPRFHGNTVNRKSMHAYYGARDLCAEVHISKVQFAAADQKLYNEVLATVKLLPEETAAAGGDPARGRAQMDEVAQASRFYIQHNYAAAAQHYQKALDMEKQKRSLDATMFRVVVDNLGMSYAFTGNLDKARDTFDYGVTQIPEYPLFHYNLACTYAEMDRLDDALGELRLAFKYKANTIPGEGFPDPMTDDSFRKFTKDPKFVDAVKEMQRP
jgi:tetratricopeptide (TPR) repeat protein